MSIRCLITVPVILCTASQWAVVKADDSATMKSSQTHPRKTGVITQAKDGDASQLAFGSCQQTVRLIRTPQEADKFEHRLRQNSTDSNARKLLIEYYTEIAKQTNASRAARKRHVFWVIQNLPASDFARDANLNMMHGSGLGADSLQRAESVWKHQLAAHPRNVKIIGNAADFFLLEESDYGIELLMRAEDLEPDNWQWPCELANTYHHKMGSLTGTQRQRIAEKALASYERWYRLTSKVRENDTCLPVLAEMAYEAEELEKSRMYATRILSLAAQHDTQTNGDAIYKGNWILGRLAVKSGEIEKAKSYLLASGQVSGSVGLDALGPNMTLAKELLEMGERQVVLDYFALCAKFWRTPKLKQWAEEVKAGKTPDFGFNLRIDL